MFEVSAANNASMIIRLLEKVTFLLIIELYKLRNSSNVHSVIIRELVKVTLSLIQKQCIWANRSNVQSAIFSLLEKKALKLTRELYIKFQCPECSSVRNVMLTFLGTWP